MISRVIVRRKSYDIYGVSMIFVAVIGIGIYAIPTILFPAHPDIPKRMPEVG